MSAPAARNSLVSRVVNRGEVEWWEESPVLGFPARFTVGARNPINAIINSRPLTWVKEGRRVEYFDTVLPPGSPKGIIFRPKTSLLGYSYNQVPVPWSVFRKHQICGAGSTYSWSWVRSSVGFACWRHFICPLMQVEPQLLPLGFRISKDISYPTPVKCSLTREPVRPVIRKHSHPLLLGAQHARRWPYWPLLCSLGSRRPVDVLKKKIKEEQEHAFAGIDSAALWLWKVLWLTTWIIVFCRRYDNFFWKVFPPISFDDATMLELVKKPGRGSGLRQVKPIETHFPSPPSSHIHIIVHLPTRTYSRHLFIFVAWMMIPLS